MDRLRTQKEAQLVAVFGQHESCRYLTLGDSHREGKGSHRGRDGEEKEMGRGERQREEKPYFHGKRNTPNIYSLKLNYYHYYLA